MISWAPVFSKIVDSSLWTEPDHVCKVFITLLAIKDYRDHVVRDSAFGIGRKCWPMDPDAEAKVLDALEILSSPDTRRIEPQPFEGRRIQKVEGGWLILNGEHYSQMMRNMNRRAYQAKKQAEYRAKRPKFKSSLLPGEAAATGCMARGDEAGADAITTEALPHCDDVPFHCGEPPQG